MTVFSVRFEAEVPDGATAALVPGGTATPHGCCLSVEVEDGEVLHEATTGQCVTHVPVTPGQTLSVTFRFDDAAGVYDPVMFQPRASRFTRVAEDLIDEVSGIAPDADPHQRACAIACATAERFTYGHPEARFNDGLDHVPALGCGLTEGSCVDINTYFIASLRAAGIEAGYVTGYFFPADKRDHCEDGHCWVVTRVGGETLEWDIAHHLKLGSRDIRPGLNPKPGFRAATFHSMGLIFPDLAITDHKALIEPMWIDGRRLRSFEAGRRIALAHPALSVAAE